MRRVERATLHLIFRAVLLSAAGCALSHRAERAAEPATEPGPAAGASAAEGPAAEPEPATETELEPDVALSEPPWFVLESLDQSRLALMRGSERIAELPAFAGWDGFREPGRTELVAAPRYLLISHVASGPQPAARGPISDDPAMQADGSVVQRIMLVRRSDLRVLWRHTGDRLREGFTPLLAADGRVVLGSWPLGAERGTVVIELDGAARTIDGVFPLTRADEHDWIAMEEGRSTPSRYGFLQLDTGERVALRNRLQKLEDGTIPDYALPAAGAEDTLEYLTPRNRDLIFVHERHHSGQDVPLGRSPTGQARIRRANDGWLINAIDRDGREQPWMWIAVASRERRAIDPPLMAGLLPFGTPVGSWFAFRSEHEEAVAGWLNAATSEWKPLPPPPDGMERFDSGPCASLPQLLPDGRALLALRDERFAAVYREDGAGGFERFSRPIRDAAYAWIERIGETVRVHAAAHEHSHCPPPSAGELAPPDLPGDTQPLRGGESELIRGDRSLMVDDAAGSALDPSGRFAVLYGPKRSVLHDLELPGRVELPGDSRVIGWLE